LDPYAAHLTLDRPDIGSAHFIGDQDVASVLDLQAAPIRALDQSFIGDLIAGGSVEAVEVCDEHSGAALDDAGVETVSFIDDSD
jgi:hypothetical protein